MKERGKIKRQALRTATGLAVVVMLAIALGAAHSVMATRKLRAVRSRLRETGVPLSWPELYARHPDVEARLDAQPAFFAALDSLTNLPYLTEDTGKHLPIEGFAGRPDIESPASPEMISALEARLRVAEPSVTAIREAVFNEPFWLVPQQPPFSPPEYWRWPAIRQAARLFTMSAILHSERREHEAAAQAVVDGLLLAQVPARGSILMDELVRLACEGLALYSLEYVLAKTRPSERSLREIVQLMEFHRDMRGGLLGEIVQMRKMYEGLTPSDIRSILEWNEAKPWHFFMAKLPDWCGWVRMNEAYHIELLHEVVTVWPLPWPEFTRRYAQASAGIPRPYVLAAIHNEGWATVKNRELRGVGAWRCGSAAVAIKLYSREHGRLPTALDELVPDYLDSVPREPFYGHPLEYKQNGQQGTLSFSYPDSDAGFTFTVFLRRIQ